MFSLTRARSFLNRPRTTQHRLGHVSEYRLIFQLYTSYHNDVVAQQHHLVEVPDLCRVRNLELSNLRSSTSSRSVSIHTHTAHDTPPNLSTSTIHDHHHKLRTPNTSPLRTQTLLSLSSPPLSKSTFSRSPIVRS